MNESKQTHGRQVYAWTVRLLELLGPPMTVFGLLLAAYQIHQANRQDEHTATVASKTDEIAKRTAAMAKQTAAIAESMSTRYVGTFPDNMEAINQLILSTKKRLWIIADVPAYGHFSRPLAHAKYRSAIQAFLSPIGNKEFRILTYNADIRREAAREQFNARSLDQLQHRNDYVEYFEYWKNRKREPKTLDEFLDNMETEQRLFLGWLQQLGIYRTECMETSSKPTTTTPTTATLPVFIWLSDDDKAIFSFFTYGAQAREISFQTNDNRIIQMLREIAKSMFDHAQEVDQVYSNSSLRTR